MCQNYKAIFLSDAPSEDCTVEIIQGFMDVGQLMSTSWLGNTAVESFEYQLSPLGKYHMCRVVWAGEFADEEPESDDNLFYYACSAFRHLHLYLDENSTDAFPYIINHTKRLFVDKRNIPANSDGLRIHPLALLTCEGNGLGVGDYTGKYGAVGFWARDFISVNDTVPTSYTEFVFDALE